MTDLVRIPPCCTPVFAQEKFFAELLFKEDHLLGQLLWDNLVEDTPLASMKFPVVTSFATVKARKRTVFVLFLSPISVPP